MLSISFLSDSDSIHRNTRIAGDTMTTTENAEAEPCAASARHARSAGAGAHGAVPVAAHHVHLVRSRTWRSSSASAITITKKIDDDRRRVADVVERERLQVEVEVDRLRRGARAARR